jgi:hypothetical protein
LSGEARIFSRNGAPYTRIEEPRSAALAMDFVSTGRFTFLASFSFDEILLDFKDPARFLDSYLGR